jgi:tetratricopeptide (TPR) repeat protein
VYLSSSTSSAGYLSVDGTVVDYSSTGVTIDIGGKTRTYPARLLQRIDTRRTDSQLQGDTLYETGDFPGALAAYRRARDQEIRSWVKREITARIVWCYRALGQTTSAAAEFLLLIRADPATPYFDCIPLAWHGSFQSRAVIPDAQIWLREESMPAAVLLGASYLLQTEHGSMALAKLQALAKSSDENVASLARAQAWRSTIITVQAEQVERWQEMVDNMPAPLRAGPYYVVGQGWDRNQQWAKAALTLARIPVLYPEHRELASRSLLDAAIALGKLERRDEANRLYTELIRDYPESPLVAEAQSRLAPPSPP